MTIISTYRFDDSAIFVSDFRTTLGNGTQYDVMLKFVEYGERLGLFLSGDVGVWKEVLPKIKGRIGEITLDNIHEPDAAFREELRFGAFKALGRGRARAVGFIIDHQTKSNRMFLVDLTPGGGASWEEIANNSGVVIGSGGLLYRIQSRVEKSARNAAANFGMDYYRIADNVRREISDCMRDAGPGSYAKLGISPYMCLSSIAGSHFMIRGEEIEGEQYKNEGPALHYKYQFIRKHDDTLVFQDLINGTEHTVYNFDTSSEVVTFDIFDPENKTETAFDISEAVSDQDCVYLFHQWVTHHTEDDVFHIYRSIQRIEFIEVPGRGRIQKCEYPIINIQEYDSQVGEKYLDCRDVYIKLHQGKEVDFQNEIDEVKLFNDNWLSEHITGYDSTFFKV